MLDLELRMCQSWYNCTEKRENLQEAKSAWEYSSLDFIEAASSVEINLKDATPLRPLAHDRMYFQM